jgi:hypothetical protein
MTFAVQTNNLLSLFVQQLQGLTSCVFFVHAPVNQKTRNYSHIIEPD